LNPTVKNLFLGGLLFRKAAKVCFCKKIYSFISILFLFCFFQIVFNLKNQFNNPNLATLVDYYEINIVSADKFTIK